MAESGREIVVSEKGIKNSVLSTYKKIQICAGKTED
jgi:hypothetical protein